MITTTMMTIRTMMTTMAIMIMMTKMTMMTWVKTPMIGLSVAWTPDKTKARHVRITATMSAFCNIVNTKLLKSFGQLGKQLLWIATTVSLQVKATHKSDVPQHKSGITLKSTQLTKLTHLNTTQFHKFYTCLREPMSLDVLLC